MSELKVRFIDDTYVEYYNTGKHDLAQVYLKSEADKVIADLEESHKMEVEQLLMEIAELKADYKEACDRLQTANLIKDEQLAATRHSNYKRCLAMADKCVDLFHKAKDLYRWAEDENLEHYYNHKIEFFARWHRRWLKIAEKFKTNSTAQQGKEEVK